MEHCSALRLSLCILLVLNMTQPVARAAADTLDPAVYARAEALLEPNLARQVQAVYASEMAPDGGSGVASRGGNLWLRWHCRSQQARRQDRPCRTDGLL